MDHHTRASSPVPSCRRPTWRARQQRPKSYKWRPVRLTHMMYRRPSLSNRECKYNSAPRQPLEQLAATLYLSPGLTRPSRASSVWGTSAPVFVRNARVFNQTWLMGKHGSPSRRSSRLIAMAGIANMGRGNRCEPGAAVIMTNLWGGSM